MRDAKFFVNFRVNKTGTAPENTIADIIDLWTLRGTIILSPGPQTVITIVMIAPLVPCIEKTYGRHQMLLLQAPVLL